MRPQEKQLNLLGLAQRASGLISGDELVLKALKQGRVKCLIVANDASQATLERYQEKAQFHKVPINLLFNKYEISHALGKSRTICAITNQGLAKKFLSYVTGEQTMNEQ